MNHNRQKNQKIGIKAMENIETLKHIRLNAFLIYGILKNNEDFPLQNSILLLKTSFYTFLI